MSSSAAFGCAAPIVQVRTQGSALCQRRRRRAQHAAVGAASLRAAAAQPGPTPLAPVVDTTWELDFYSRPVVGVDGKKLWELVIVDASGRMEHVEAIPNSLVNSRELRKRIQAVVDESVTKPTVVRFFRTQMLNMITIALSGIDVEVRPSRRTYALMQLLRERERDVYPSMPGFKPELVSQKPTFLSVDLGISQRLPDALRCEKFAFGRLPLEQVEGFFAGASSQDFFGDSCLVDDDLSRDSFIPGVIVFSKRAKALSGWMSGVELAFVRSVMGKQELVLECGLNTRYLFAGIDDTIKGEAKDFQDTKADVRGLHFLAIQESEDTDEVEGFWLLTESAESA